MHRMTKGEKTEINCGENYAINTMLNVKARFVREKKKNAIIREMYWCNVLRRTGSDFCQTDNFLRTFTHFGFMIFNTLERISTYVDPVIVEKEL